MVRSASGTSSGRLLAVAAGVGMVVAGWVPAAVAEPGPECVAEAPDVASASALAAECGVPVEVLDARTEWETTWALPDGLMRWEVSATAVRADTGDGWVEVDPTVVPGDEGFVVAAPATAMVFADGSGQEPLARIERDGAWLSIEVPFDLPVPVVIGRQLTYEQVADGVDLVVTVDEDATGFTQVVRVASPEAAGTAEVAELVAAFAVSEGIDVEDGEGGFVGADAAGERVFSVSEAVLWDSAPLTGPEASTRGFEGPDGVGGEGDLAVGPADGQVAVVLDGKVGPGVMTAVLDEAVVADPGTVWPVYAGQKVSASRHAWTRVSDKLPPAFKFGADEGVGRCQNDQYMSCSPSPFKARLLWMFTGLATIGALDPADVISATFSVYGAHSYSCTPQPVTLYRVGDFDASTSWPGGGLWDPLDTRVVTHRAACGSDDLRPRWIEFNATGQARAIAAAGTSVGSLGLAANEETNTHWKRYRNDATFSVDYNQAPDKPTGAGTVSPGSACVYGGVRPVINSATPTLRATISDPDGGNVEGRFELWRVTDGVRLWGPHPTAAKLTGSAHSAVVPAGLMVDNVVYQWRVRGVDPHGKAGPQEWCEFIVDLVAPNRPTVAPVTGQAGFYAENAWGGGLGKTGKFVFGNNGSADVTSYKYSFNNTALTQTVAASSPTVSFTPTAVGLHTLRVQSVDRAGWTSPVRTYTFAVAMAGKSSHWHFDEGAGMIAQDSVGSSPLTRTASTAWTDGLLAAIGFDPADRGLLFDQTADQATSAAAVVATNQSFSVTAIVRLDAVGSTSATAISQDGEQVSGFSLGYRAHSTCPGSMTGCLSMFMYPSDAVVSPVQAASAVPVQAHHWYGLIGMYDATNKRIGMAACDLGTAENPAPPVATAPTVTWTGHDSTWQALGKFAVGRGQSGGQTARSWPGVVSEVRVYDGPIGDAEMLRVCAPIPNEPGAGL